MAIKIQDEYAARSNAPTGDYPTGSIKDRTVPGAEDGTPLTAIWGNDMVGFTDALLNEGTVAHSGAADTKNASDRLQALKNVARFDVAKMLLIKGGAKNYAAGVSFTRDDVCIDTNPGGGNDTICYEVILDFTATGNFVNDSVNLRMIDLGDIAQKIPTIEGDIQDNTDDINEIKDNNPSFKGLWSGDAQNVSTATLAAAFTDGVMQAGTYLVYPKQGEFGPLSTPLYLYKPLKGTPLTNSYQFGNQVVSDSGVQFHLQLGGGNMSVVKIPLSNPSNQTKAFITSIQWAPAIKANPV